MTTKPSELNQNTRVPLSWIIALCGFLCAVTWRITAATWQIAAMHHQLETVTEEMTELQELCVERTQKRWTIVDMQDWIDRANREVEIWSIQSEILNQVESGAWVRFCFPPTITHSDH